MTIFVSVVTRMEREAFPSVKAPTPIWVSCLTPTLSLNYVFIGNSGDPSPEHTLIEPKPDQSEYK